MIVRYLGMAPEDMEAVFGQREPDPEEMAFQGDESTLNKCRAHEGRLAIVERVSSGGFTGESEDDPLFHLKFASGWRWSAFRNEIEKVFP